MAKKEFTSDAEEALYTMMESPAREPERGSALDAAVLQEKIRRKANRRLASLDALRGLNMLCIIGLASLITAICNLEIKDFQVFGEQGVQAARAFREYWPGPSPEGIAKHMEHVEWNGLLHHDTIFPLFLFLAGVSFPFSYAKQRANGRPMWRVIVKILIRGIALFIAGYLYQNKVRFNFSDLRFMGVLQHIGLAWMFAALIFLALARHWKAQIGICAAILISYWLLVALVPARDVAPDEAFTAKAFQARAEELFTIRAPEILPEPESPAPTESAPAQAQLAELAGPVADNAEPAAENKPTAENAEGVETAAPVEEAPKKHSLKGIFAGLFNNNPLPSPGDPDYPEIGTVDHNLLPEGCVVNYIDRQYVPGRLYHDSDNARAKMRRGEIESAYDPALWRTLRDPEGLASTFPAIVTALLGMLFGGILRREDVEVPKLKKVALLVGWGAVLMVIGFLWHLVFPINKNLWNSSFVCFVGGYSAIALGLFYLVIDVAKQRWIGWPFMIVGMNCFGIFVIRRIVDFSNARNFFFADAIERFIPNEYPDPAQVIPEGVDPATVEQAMIAVNNFQNIATICAGLIVAWVFLFWLYRKRIFFKL